MNHNTYVIGHKHPDSDSICSAIAYTNLLNKLGQPAIACRQGPLNEETKFILKQFGQENPLLLKDARAMLSDIDIDAPNFISALDTVHHAWHMMLQTQNRSMFVVDEVGKLVGICTTSNLAKVRLHPDADLMELLATATLDNIARTVGGVVAYRPENFKTCGRVTIVTLEGNEVSKYPLKDGICILTSGKDKQRLCMEQGAKLLVITCDVPLDSEILEDAKKYDCAIITTENDTMHTARVITESYSVEQVMSRDSITFRDNEYVEDVAIKMHNSRVRSYPVLDEEGEVIGAISRYHTRDYSRRKFALVDHSTTIQTINNIDKAEIVAIIDHHHIGDVTTDSPIEYRNHRCGCTCTIVYSLYKEYGVEISPLIAGVMLSAIISDTLNLKSATTTDEDRRTVTALAEIAGIPDVNDYARRMLGASVALSDASMHDILVRDLKVYQVGKYRMGIGQTNYSHMEEVQKILPEFRVNLEQETDQRKLDLMVMLFTDVMGEGSLFVYYGPLSYVFDSVLETKIDDHSGFDPNIISRKQQLIPSLTKIIKNL